MDAEPLQSSDGFECANSVSKHEQKLEIDSDAAVEQTDGIPTGDDERSGEDVGESSSPPTKLISRGHWRADEDDKLKELVVEMGPQNWNLIAKKLGGRTGKSCRLRWFNQLNPRINKKPFSEQEEMRLAAAHSMFGNKWATIRRFFPGRTDNSLKNRWHVMVAQKHREVKNAGVGRNLLNSRADNKRMFLRKTPVDESNLPSNNSVAELPSSCTNLSLTPPGNGSIAFLSSSGKQFFHRWDQMASPGEKGKMIATSWVGFCQLKTNWLFPQAALINQSAQSDAYSEVYASESATNGTNTAQLPPLNRTIVKGTEDRKPSPFIDFLGVGAT